MIGTATSRMPENIEEPLEVFGTADWLQMARRGLFSFDWKVYSGPYLRAATPSVPVEITALARELQRLVRLAEFPDIWFAEMQSVQPEGLRPCE